jgi:hypothetical protein
MMRVPGHFHGSVQAVAGAEPVTLTVGEKGRQVLALSIVNASGARDIEVRLAGSRITSWLPAVVRIGPRAGIGFFDGKFTGVPPGRKLPVYAVLGADQERGRLEIIDTSDGSLIRAADIVRGRGHGLHHP